MDNTPRCTSGSANSNSRDNIETKELIFLGLNTDPVPKELDKKAGQVDHGGLHF